MKQNYEIIIGVYSIYSNKNIQIIHAIDVLKKAFKKDKFNKIFEYKKQKYIVVINNLDKKKLQLPKIRKIINVKTGEELFFVVQKNQPMINISNCVKSPTCNNPNCIKCNMWDWLEEFEN